MKSTLRGLLTLAAIGAAVVMMSGCYTQFNSSRDDEGYSSGQDTSYADNHGGYDNQGYYGGYDDGGYYNSRARLGFSYYYPSYYWPSYQFSMAYGDPWFYDSYSYNNPFVCGTPYVSYSPYGYGYSPWYAGAGYYYGAPYYGVGYKYAGNSFNRGRRLVGTTRGSSEPMGSAGPAAVPDTRPLPPVDRGGYNLPSGARTDYGTATGGGVSVPQGQKNTARQAGGQGRGSTPHATTRTGNRQSPSVRGWGTRGGTNRGESRKNGDTQPQRGTYEGTAPPPASSSAPAQGSGQQASPRSNGGGSRDGGSSRGGSTSTPPSGSRGGSTRGGRP